MDAVDAEQFDVSLLLIMLTCVSLRILIQKATATSEMTVVTLEKDTVCNKVGYVPDFAQSAYSWNIELVLPLAFIIKYKFAL